MATLRGGDISQFTFDSREFDVKNDSNITYRLSGLTVENLPNGNGTMHGVGRRKLAGIDAVPLSVDPDKEDLEFLEARNNGTPYTLNITMINGTVYSGQLAIEGDLDANTGDGQAEVTFRGAKFEKI